MTESAYAYKKNIAGHMYWCFVFDNDNDGTKTLCVNTSFIRDIGVYPEQVFIMNGERNTLTLTRPEHIAFVVREIEQPHIDDKHGYGYEWD